MVHAFCLFTEVKRTLYSLKLIPLRIVKSSVVQLQLQAREVS